MCKHKSPHGGKKSFLSHYISSKPFFSIRDRAQTTINVLGDTYAAAIVGKYSVDDLKEETKSGSVETQNDMENTVKNFGSESNEETAF